MNGLRLQHIEFPALALFRDGAMSVKEDLLSLQRASRYALKRRVHEGLRIIDRTGKEFVVESATKLGTIGRFWGWSPVYGQIVRVDLNFKPGYVSRSLAEVRDVVLTWFTKWEGWEEAGNWPEPRDSVRNAASMDEIINALRDPAER